MDVATARLPSNPRFPLQTLDVCDGVDALSKLDGSKFNLIICDVHMPNMDGITFVKKAKEMETYKFPPVCMLTTESAELIVKL